MRSYGSVVIGNLGCAVILCFPVPLALLIGYQAWRAGEDWAWIALAVGGAGSAAIPLMTLRFTRDAFPRITRGDGLKDRSVSYGDDTFVLWAPRSEQAPAQARLVRADVLEASLGHYEPEGGGTFTTYGGDFAPDEFTPVIRMRLHVRDGEETGGGAPFDVTVRCRVPSLCLSAVTAGRLAVLIDPGRPADPADPLVPGRVTPLWPRSALLAGTRTCRVIGLDGRLTDVTRHPERQLRQMRISLEAGGIEMDGDTIDLRRLDPAVAARYTAVAEQERAAPEDRAPVTEPGEEYRWLVDSLPGEAAGFGSVGRRWSRRGGVLVRARFLQMTATHTFQHHGPVLDTVLRIHPADGTPAFDAARRMTVPMGYLAVLHRTREVVLYAAPDGRSFVVDWPRTGLLAGTAAAAVITPDGRELPLAGRPEVVWALMNLLASRGLSNPDPVLDLRRRRLRGAAGAVMEMLGDSAPAVGAQDR
ncbi:hypothetical protein ACIQM0_27660 [Streptomyces sp. NPDC091387]|uniref:hypothetical protein n=1 Tax=Streptomyces sp. NPDC091387 TaxID=3365998 RepID=UPI003801AD32